MITSRQKQGDEMLKLLITLSIYELNTSLLTSIGIPVWIIWPLGQDVNYELMLASSSLTS